jgi:hypothetical protein
MSWTLHKNRHNTTDVIFGAALGITAGRVTSRRDRSRVMIQPTVSAAGAGLVAICD